MKNRFLSTCILLFFICNICAQEIPFYYTENYHKVKLIPVSGKYMIEFQAPLDENQLYILQNEHNCKILTFYHLITTDTTIFHYPSIRFRKWISNILR
jgi:hypothetical protein